MKPASTSSAFPTSSEQIKVAIERAPLEVGDPDCPYDPNDAVSVSTFWRHSLVRRPGQRGPGRKPKKVLLSIRYSPEVVEYFKSKGEGWQSRMDQALQEWVAAHKPA